MTWELCLICSSPVIICLKKFQDCFVPCPLQVSLSLYLPQSLSLWFIFYLFFDDWFILATKVLSSREFLILRSSLEKLNKTVWSQENMPYLSKLMMSIGQFLNGSLYIQNIHLSTLLLAIEWWQWSCYSLCSSLLFTVNNRCHSLEWLLLKREYTWPSWTTESAIGYVYS